MKIAGTDIGPGRPCYIIAEAGINHNGDADLACKLVDAAADAGANAVKFQKRTPALAVPDEMKNVPRETPWGVMSYLKYKHRIELSFDDYAQIDRRCKERGIAWFVSCWDATAVRQMGRFHLPAQKVASACLTDHALLRCLVDEGKPLIMSTGMSTPAEITAATEAVKPRPFALLHSTSAYPAAPESLNLLAMQALPHYGPQAVGYSGHESGLQTTVAAVAMGAQIVERHLTLDRSMWGTDQAASVEPQGFKRLVRDIRTVELAMGDGVKRVMECEREAMKKLRRSHAV